MPDILTLVGIGGWLAFLGCVVITVLSCAGERERVSIISENNFGKTAINTAQNRITANPNFWILKDCFFLLLFFNCCFFWTAVINNLIIASKTRQLL